jgi:3-oxoacyl-[acyl-carrier-protein] synthase II
VPESAAPAEHRLLGQALSEAKSLFQQQFGGDPALGQRNGPRLVVDGPEQRSTLVALGAEFFCLRVMPLHGASDDQGPEQFAALVEPIVAGFATMNAAYQVKPGREAEPPQAASRPFSRDRRGFVIAEGAGAVILATRAFAAAHGLSPVAELAGWAMTSDAHHFVAPHLPTVARCMAESVDNAGICLHDVASVNAHAASTKIGDQVECEALQAVFGKRLPPVSANKSLIGHAMGASSAIETILAMEGMRRDTLLPTLNYTPDPELVLDCVPEGARRLKQEFVLKNAFGFGGCNACMVLRRIG